MYWNRYIDVIYEIFPSNSRKSSLIYGVELSITCAKKFERDLRLLTEVKSIVIKTFREEGQIKSWRQKVSVRIIA